MKYSFTILLVLFTITLYGQETLANYWVEFTDKQNTPYSIFEPTAFLSPKALQRRQRMHIPIDSTDLPVSPTYLDAIREKGIVIRHTSKWLNAATILSDSSSVAQLKELSFVSTITRVGRYHPPQKKKVTAKRKLPKDYKKTKSYYGYGAMQIGLVNGHALHRLGYQGAGVLVGVQDGGFSNADIMPFFDSTFVNNKMWQGKDFVDGDNYVYESATHGSSVLSVMASNIPYLLVGTAPTADYLCMKTEDVRSETLTEECNWVAALEYADSIGVDVVNSSLGYTQFSLESMNYTYKDLNGQQSRASRAADVAVAKGVFVVNSAGNSGADSWRYIGTPADSREIFSIGAITSEGQRARFSSFGPTSDGRIKPNIVALGQRTVVAGNGYDIGLSNGTSLSSPLIAGLVASLKQAFPNHSNYQIRTAIENSASQANSPDNVLGYGIPDFYMTYRLLKDKKSSIQALDAYYENGQVEIVFLDPTSQKGLLELKDQYGKLLKKVKVSSKKLFEQEQLEYPLSNGVYQVSLKTKDTTLHSFFVVH